MLYMIYNYISIRYFRIMNVIRKYLPCLTSLDVSHSCITDKGLRHLMSPLCVLHRPDQPNPNIIRNLTSFLDSPEKVYTSNLSKCIVSQILKKLITFSFKQLLIIEIRIFVFGIGVGRGIITNFGYYQSFLHK